MKNITTAVKPIAKLVMAVGLVAGASVSMPALAGKKLEIDDTKWISVGAGLRTVAKITEDASPSGDDATDCVGYRRAV